MPTVDPQVLYRRSLKSDNETLFGWKSLPKSTASYYKLYESTNADGPFLLLKDNILNQRSTDNAYKGKVLTRILDSQVPIAINEDHYFKVTYVDNSSVESSLADAPVKIVHPPQIDWDNSGQDTDNYVYNHCYDEERHRWVKGRLLSKCEYQTVTIGTSEQILTFDQDVFGLEIQNQSSTATITTNLNGDSIATNGGIPIYAREYYTAGRFIKGNVGITLLSSEPSATVTVVGHF